jgi:cyanate permease
MSQPPSIRRYAIGSILFLSYAAFSVTWMALAPLSGELMAFFAVDKASFALLGTVVTISKIVAPLLAGYLATKIGVKNTILLGSVSIATAVLGPLFPTFNVFLVTRAIYGIGGAVLLSLVPAMLMVWFPKNELSFVNGINGVAANTGFALAMFLTPLLAASPTMAFAVPAWGLKLQQWQGTLVTFSLVSLALTVAWAIVGRDSQSSDAAKPTSPQRAPASASEAPSLAAPPASSVSYLDVWKMKETWLIALAFSGPVSLYLTLATWLPRHYQEQFGFTQAQAANYTSIILFTGIPSAVISGYLTQRLGVRRPFLIVGGALSGTLAFGTFLSGSPHLISISCLLLGACLFIPKAALLTATMELKGATPRHVALISSTMVSVCYIFNSFIPYLVGKVADLTGSFVPGFVGLTLFSWVVVVAGFLLPETGPKARGKVLEPTLNSAPGPSATAAGSSPV